MSTLKYLVTGASGQLGAKTIEALLKTEAPETIGALVRRPETGDALRAKGVTVRVGSYDDPASLETAFAGVERLLLISSSEVGQRAPQHMNVVNAAKVAGVGFVAYTSLLKAKSTDVKMLAGEHIVTEDALAASGLSYALLRNGWYNENFAMSAGPALEHGALIGAAGEGRFTPASRQDFADAAAAVLTGDLPASGTIYELGGDEVLTYADLAAFLSEVSGKEIPYVNMTQEALAEALTQAGVPGPFAAVLAESDFAASTGSLEDSSKTLSGLIGRPTTPWRETLAEALKG